MKKICILLIIVIEGAKLYGQPGTLDSSFGNNGISFTNLSSAGQFHKISLSNDNSFIAAGSVYNSHFDILLAKFLSDGKIDASFGNNGTAQLNLGEDALLSDFAIQSDSKILICGNIYPTAFADGMFLTKFLPTGALDTSFGNAGLINNDTLLASCILPLKNEQFYLFGMEPDYWEVYHLFIAKYMCNGALDSSFGIKGKITYQFSDDEYEEESASSAFLQKDGKIVIIGSRSYQDQFGYSSPFIARFFPDGRLDSSFGYNGFNVLPIDDYYSFFSDGIIQNGKIITIGGAGDFFAETASNLIAGYTENGILDSTFGDNGFKIFKTKPKATLRAIASDNNKKVVCVSGNNLIKLNSYGNFDSSFGTNGISYSDVEGNDLLIQNNGKIVVSGYVSFPNELPVLARFNNNINQKQVLIARIKRWLNHHNGIVWQNVPGTIAYSVERSTDKTNWTTVSSRRLLANQQCPVNYYEDPSPAYGINYYQVQTTSTDNITAASNIIAIENNGAAGISIFPNPTKDILNIKGLDVNTKYEVSIADEKGNVVVSATIKNNTVYKYNVTALKKGVHYVSIKSDKNNIISLKFLKE